MFPTKELQQQILRLKQNPIKFYLGVDKTDDNIWVYYLMQNKNLLLTKEHAILDTTNIIDFQKEVDFLTEIFGATVLNYEL